uniref:Uncharacterized protein n=1 Tax=Lepeophtheirus salmonis TaxID=72036 RepID=A0A0K2VLJ3_LEPSM
MHFLLNTIFVNSSNIVFIDKTTITSKNRFYDSIQKGRSAFFSSAFPFYIVFKYNCFMGKYF